MYKLFFRVKGGLKTIYSATSAYLRQKGEKLTNDNKNPKNAIAYIQVSGWQVVIAIEYGI